MKHTRLFMLILLALLLAIVPAWAQRNKLTLTDLEPAANKPLHEIVTEHPYSATVTKADPGKLCLFVIEYTNDDGQVAGSVYGGVRSGLWGQLVEANGAHYNCVRNGTGQGQGFAVPKEARDGTPLLGRTLVITAVEIDTSAWPYVYNDLATLVVEVVSR